MRNFLLVLISVMFATSLFAAQDAPQKDPVLCKIFQDKIIKYKESMRNDEYAMVTLMSYEKRAAIYCPKK